MSLLEEQIFIYDDVILLDEKEIEHLPVAERAIDKQTYKNEVEKILQKRIIRNEIILVS